MPRAGPADGHLARDLGRRRPVELGMPAPCGLWCEGALRLCKPIAERRARAAHAGLGSAGALAPPTAPFYLRVWHARPAPRPRMRDGTCAERPAQRPDARICP